jgi:hypothetical protein
MRGKRENSLRKGMLLGPVNGLDQLRMMFCAARHPLMEFSSGRCQSAQDRFRCVKNSN